ncbi:MAG: amidohydrolase family protein [Candidatus Rokubacteria bacterium]|nr:amidohydrolase family protein [Candidatus Rokubacteria bacterium]
MIPGRRERVSLRALLDVVEPSHILFGSDYPFAVPNVEQVLMETIEGISNFEGFDAAQRCKVERENALALFPRLAVS